MIGYNLYKAPIISSSLIIHVTQRPWNAKQKYQKRNELESFWDVLLQKLQKWWIMRNIG